MDFGRLPVLTPICDSFSNTWIEKLSQEIIVGLKRVAKQAAYISEGLQQREGKTFWIDPVAVEFLNAMLERHAQIVREEWDRRN